MENWKEFEGKLSFLRNITTEICHRSCCQASSRGRVGRMTVQLRQLKFQFVCFLLQIKHKVYLSLVRRLEGHSSQIISGSIRRKTGSLRPTSLVEESISLQHLL